MIDPIRALRIIEGMVIEDCDNDSRLADIYTVAHQASWPDCAANHPDFEKRTLEIEKQLVQSKIIDKWHTKTS